MFLFISLLLFSCETDIPFECEEMCQSAEVLTENCLMEWELDWDAAGYENNSDFQESCNTWVWEQQLLIEDAESQGKQSPNLADICLERKTIIRSDMTDCNEIALWGETIAE
jgi:hypothetical protein